MAIRASLVEVDVKEVNLKNKPPALLQASPKATVPVLILQNGEVIEESLDIMYWALQQNDPDNWLAFKDTSQTRTLIEYNDTVFKTQLDHYKYADRFPRHPQSHYRQEAEHFLSQLESRLNNTPFLSANSPSLSDIALLPFIRQFAYVDIKWFEHAPWPKLRTWLFYWLESALFQSVMLKDTGN